MTDPLIQGLEPGETLVYRSPLGDKTNVLVSTLQFGLVIGGLLALFGWIMHGPAVDLSIAAVTAIVVMPLYAFTRTALVLPAMAVTDRRLLFLPGEKGAEPQELALEEITEITSSGPSAQKAIHGRSGTRIALSPFPDDKRALEALQRVKPTPVRVVTPPRLLKAARFGLLVALLTAAGALFSLPVLYCSIVCGLGVWLGTPDSILAVLVSILAFPLLVALLFLLWSLVSSLIVFLPLRFLLSPEEMAQFLAIDIDWHSEGALHRFLRKSLVLSEVFASLLYGRRIRAQRPPE